MAQTSKKTMTTGVKMSKTTTPSSMVLKKAIGDNVLA